MSGDGIGDMSVTLRSGGAAAAGAFARTRQWEEDDSSSDSVSGSVSESGLRRADGRPFA
jgi:hypothetical protein